MTPRLSGHISIFGLVVFVLKFLLRIAGQWSREKFAILTLKPWSHVRILTYRTWAIYNLLLAILNNSAVMQLVTSKPWWSSSDSHKLFAFCLKYGTEFWIFYTKCIRQSRWKTLLVIHIHMFSLLHKYQTKLWHHDPQLTCLQNITGRHKIYCISFEAQDSASVHHLERQVHLIINFSSLSWQWGIFNNYSSSPNGLWVNSPWDQS